MHYFLAIVVIAVLITAGCSTKGTETTVSPAQTPMIISPVQSPVPDISHVTVAPASSPTYKTAREVWELNKYPQYGFIMDYPTDWAYSRMDTLSFKGGYLFSKTGENFLYPKSYALLYFDDRSDYGYSEPMGEWINNTRAQPYCNDGAGHRMRQDDCPSRQRMYYPFLASDEPVTINGTVEARKLVFRSEDDRNYGELTVYLMYAGRMQGYNYTIPGEKASAVKVDGPVWDYARGGQRYAIEFYSDTDQMNTTSALFDHMINSFEPTVKL